MKQRSQRLPTYDFQPEDDLGRLALRCALLEVQNDYDFSEPHRHNYYEVFFFKNGGGSHLIDFVEHEVAAHSVHILTPGQVHLLRRAPESHGAVLHFSKDILPHSDAVYSLVRALPGNVINHSEREYEAVVAVLQVLQRELTESSKIREVILTCLSLLLLKSISSGNHNHVQAGSRVMQNFKAFRQLVEENYRTGKLPKWYALQLHITERQLNEICRDATGDTVSSYLKGRLLLEAKRLLSHSAGSIKEIGYFLGFEDPAYFTRFFRKNAGVTAGEFRKQFKMSN